ncbi:MAG: type II secretion system minor pseudopilin GspH [Pseudomonadota bacterium]|nr:type II secretion system minor pseudopilin GspH [Pseudomonadota bacterium]
MCPDAIKRTVASGFTLIEVLVVIVIIGVIVTLTTLTASDSRAPLKREAQRLAALLALAQEEAVFQAQEWGLSVHSDRYQFYIWQQQGWQVVQNDDLFRPRAMPQGIHIELQLDGHSLRLAEGEEQQRPQILILSSGECTPFELTFSDETDPSFQYQLQGNLLGALSIHRYD